MNEYILIKKTLPQNPNIEVFVPDYKEPILPVEGGYGWYGLQSYNEQGQLMCNECGVFRNALSLHVREHKLSVKQYKIKYSLMSKTKLVSEDITNKFRDIAKKNHSLDKTPEVTRKAVIAMLKARREKKGKPLPLEFLNKQGTCPAQCLSRLIAISCIEGDKPTVRQIRNHDSSLEGLLISRFGSLNKARQIVKLMPNIAEPVYTRRMIIEDMIGFYRKYHRWPLRKDYDSGLMICRKSTLSYKNGGLINLRQEAKELKQEQDSIAIFGSEQIPRIAENIERQFAGISRR